jgi:hypothetical protein
MATPVKAWTEAREQGIELQFPSGNIAAIRPLEVDFFLSVGHIPDVLIPVVTKMINGDPVKKEEFAMPAFEEIEKSEQWRTFLNELVAYGFVTPGASLTPKEDQISVWDVSYGDKLYLYGFFGRPAALLRSFRQFQIDALANVAAAASNENTSQPNSGDQRVGKQDIGHARQLDSASIR